MNPDRLYMVPARETIQTAYGAIDGMQSHPAEQQVMAAAVVFREFCEVLRLEPSQMLDAALRLQKHATEHFSIEINALRTYIREELRKS